VHAKGCSLPYWLVVLPRRHVESLDELTDDEMADLGPLLSSLTRALKELTGCAKTYVALFAEAAGYAHVHFHVVPRMQWFTVDQKGPSALSAFLGAVDDEVPEQDRDTIAGEIRSVLQP
jgi:diadenosine tetraphosphate (Ap4A) HIT family hydrolase